MQLIAQAHTIMPPLALVLFAIAATMPGVHPVLKAILFIGAGCLLGIDIGWTAAH